MSISDHEGWFAFCAYNAQACYGYGTASEAEKYADQLNAGREINHFAPRALNDWQVEQLKLETNDLGFSLSIALSDSEDDQ